MVDYDEVPLLADALAVEAGAVTHCFNHEEIVLAVDDSDKTRAAHSLVEERYRDESGEFRRCLHESIHDLINSAADECPYDGCDGE